MIKYNGKDIIPRLNGKELSRVMYNGKKIYPNVITTDFLEGAEGLIQQPYCYVDNITNWNINYDNTYYREILTNDNIELTDEEVSKYKAIYGNIEIPMVKQQVLTDTYYAKREYWYTFTISLTQMLELMQTYIVTDFTDARGHYIIPIYYDGKKTNHTVVFHVMNYGYTNRTSFEWCIPKLINNKVVFSNNIINYVNKNNVSPGDNQYYLTTNYFTPIYQNNCEPSSTFSNFSNECNVPVSIDSNYIQTADLSSVLKSDRNFKLIMSSYASYVLNTGIEPINVYGKLI
jgi:hypothetical protein